MKRIIIILLLVLSCSSAAFAQHNLRTGYFLDGYAYKHKLNPAFGSDRGYFAIPVAGYATLGVESNLALSTFLYPTADGRLTTFLSPDVSAEEFLSKIHNNNPLNVNTDISLISLGFNAGKSFNTIDLSLKADVRANVPGAMFSWAKQYGNTLDMSNFVLNADARLELAYGFSYKIGDWLRFGFKLKALAGLVKADYSMDKLTLTMNEDKWMVDSYGKGYFRAPGIGLSADGEDGAISGLNMPSDYNVILDDFLKFRNLGAAVDLGISMDLIKYLTVSASVTDLGFIKWNDVTGIGSAESRLEYSGFENIGEEEVTIGDQLSALGEEALEMISPKIMSEGETLTDMLSMTAHLGLEFRMPFWQRLSVGALGTYRFDGPYSWWEARGSVNLALFRWLSFSGNYAYSSFGESYGAAVNLHPGGINLFIGIDSFKPALNVTPQYVPIDNLNTNVAFGLNIAFGKYKGRFPKKQK